MDQQGIKHENTLMKLVFYSLDEDASVWYRALPQSSVTSSGDFHAAFNSFCKTLYLSKFLFEDCCEYFSCQQDCGYRADNKVSGDKSDCKRNCLAESEENIVENDENTSQEIKDEVACENFEAAPQSPRDPKVVFSHSFSREISENDQQYFPGKIEKFYAKESFQNSLKDVKKSY